MENDHVLVPVLILLAAATGVATLCHYLRMPTIVGFIMAGVVVGPSGLGLVASLPNADAVAEAAVIFLMFTIGLEFSFGRLLGLRREFLRLGLPQVVLTIMAAAIPARALLGLPLNQAVFLGMLVSLSSTALVIKLLQDAREMETPYGRQSLSILLFQDLAVIGMMLCLPLLAGGKVEGALATARLTLTTLAEMAVKVVAIPVGMWAASRYLIPFVLERVVRTRSRELFFFCVLTCCFGIASLFQLGGLSLSLGAFAAGMMIADGPYGRQVTADILPLRDNFLGLFFVSVGMLLDLSFVASHVFVIIGIGLALFLIKTTIVAVAALVNRTPAPMAVMVGMILAQIGEFSFILVESGADRGLIDHEFHQYFLATSVLSMIFTPFLFRIAPKVALSGDRWRQAASGAATATVRAIIKQEVKSDQRAGAAAESGRAKAGGDGHAGHAVIIGYGIAGQNMASAMKALGIPHRIIELNYEAVKRLRKTGVPISFGDATKREVLEHAGVEGAKLVVIATSGAKLMPSIIAAVRDLRPDVQIIVRAQYVREVEGIERQPNTEIVVAEIETSVELLARALQVYGVASDAIRDYMTAARTQMDSFAQMTGRLKSPQLNLPSWEALAAIRPLRIDSEFRAVGMTLAALNLPHKAGVSVVSVYRDGLGTAIPDGGFVLAAGDVAHVIGTPQAIRKAEKLLETGT